MKDIVEHDTVISNLRQMLDDLDEARQIILSEAFELALEIRVGNGGDREQTLIAVLTEANEQILKARNYAKREIDRYNNHPRRTSS